MLKKSGVTLFLLFAIFTGTLLVYAGLHFGGATSFGYGSLKANVEVNGATRYGSVTISVNATGSGLTALCQNKGGNTAVGQNPIPIGVSVSASQTVQADRRGDAAASFEMSLVPSSRDAGCPNDQWKVVDLLGSLQVTLTAVDNSKHNSFATETLTCTVDQANEVVTCS